jgi:hypothetical protein
VVFRPLGRQREVAVGRDVPAFTGKAGVEVAAHQGQPRVSLGDPVGLPVYGLWEGGLLRRGHVGGLDLRAIPQAGGHLSGHRCRRESLVRSERRSPRSTLDVERFGHLTLSAPTSVAARVDAGTDLGVARGAISLTCVAGGLTALSVASIASIASTTLSVASIAGVASAAPSVAGGRRGRVVASVLVASSVTGVASILTAPSVAGVASIILGRLWALGSRVIDATQIGRSVSKPLFPAPGCGEPNIEVELVHGARRPKPSVLYGSIPPDAHPSSLQPHQRRLLRSNRLPKEHVLGPELHVVVQFASKVKSLVALPIAIAQ